MVSEGLTRRTVRQARKSKILWVDDQPENNASERKVFENLGMTIRLATSTEQAMNRLFSERFDLVISDMGRPPDQRAGYTLLSEMKADNIEIPVIFYAAGGNRLENRKEAKNRGAFASTNGATDLFYSVFKALDAF